MTVTLRQRLAWLEARTTSTTVGGVVRQLPGESVEMAVARSGRIGGVLLVPAQADPARWQRETVAQQKRLMVTAATWIAEQLAPLG